MSQNQETEVKIRISKEELPKIRRILKSLGARGKTPMQKESNRLYDLPDGSLRNSGSLLRTRRYGQDCLLTFKGPATYRKGVKIRMEHETHIQDTEGMDRILRSLGYAVVFEYQKEREMFLIEIDGEEAIVCLDFTPVGHFIEVEGTEHSIHKVLQSMQFKPDQFEKRNYVELYRQAESGTDAKGPGRVD